MRIATWNVNGLRARLEYVLLWLQARRPDVVGLQELKLTAEQFPTDALAAAGYSAVLSGQKGWNGVAVLSPWDVTLEDSCLPGQEGAGARLISARTAGLTYTSVYVPNGKDVDHPDFEMKLGWLDALADHLRSVRATGGPAVVGGDFNVCPSALDTWDEDGHRGAIFHTEAERVRFQNILDLGLRDLFRERYPEAREFSWWDYRAGAFHRNHGLRIDFVLGTRAVGDRVRGAWIDRDYRKKKDGLTPSDHAPVIVDLE